MKPALLLAATLAAFSVCADQIDMKNGDRYTGRVVSLSADSIVLENDLLGKVTVPRSRVVLLTVGAPTPNGAGPVAPIVPGATNVASSAVPAAANAPIAKSDDIAQALRQLGANTNFVSKIKGQFLAEAGPEANQKFDELLSGLMSGNIDMNGLRAQAQSAAEQLKKYQKDIGPEGADTMNTYLTILDNFLNETSGGSLTGTSTNRF